MRGNSGFLRWLLSSTSSVVNRLFCIGLIISLLLSSVLAGPLSLQSRRQIREIYAEIETQTQNITQPTEGTCLYDGVPVPETSVQCEKKSGCRAIQKTGYCCPDYQCDCERNGKIYANGEKLVDPEEPCKGCYCQGGEILCNSVNCYIRHDCQPKYIPGRCCPEYDNCPPLEAGRPTSIKDITTTETPSTSASIVTSNNELSSSSSSAIPKQEANNNPLGIKIKEITKPEEIRIIDEKPKPTYQLIKPFESSASNQPKTYAPNALKIEQPPVVVVQTIGNSAKSQPVKPQDAEVAAISTTAAPSAQLSEIDSSLASTTQITLVEISTESNRLESADVNSITDGDALKIVRHTEQSIDGFPANESSTTEANTVEKETVGDTGKEVLIVNSNGETKPITVFGVEGLQRGDVLEEVLEYDEKKTAAKRSDSNPPISTTEPEVYSSSTEPEVIYENSSSAGVNGNDDGKTVSEIDPVGSSSDDFVRIIATTTTKMRESTTEGAVEEQNQSTESNREASNPEEVEDSVANSSAIEAVYHPAEPNAALVVVSTEGPKTPSDLVDDDDVVDEPNPAYPTIVDDISVYQTQVLEADDEMSGKDEKILPEVLELLSNSTHQINGTSTEVQEAWLKIESNVSSTSEGDLIDNVTSARPQERSPGEPLLIPEWERNATELIGTNETIDALESESFLLSNGSTELESALASGDGPSRSPSERESTTPNPLRDADEDGSGRAEYSPKHDSESAKYSDDSDTIDTGLRYLTSAIEDLRQSSLMDILTFP